MSKRVNTTQEIAQRWRVLGIPFQPDDLDIEHDRQTAWFARENEDYILEHSPDSQGAAEIRASRAAGKWTRVFEFPAPTRPHLGAVFHV